VLLRGPNNPWLSRAGRRRQGGRGRGNDNADAPDGELETIVEIAGVTIAICDHRFREELNAAAPYGFQIFTYGGSDEDDLTRVAEAKRSKFKNAGTAADDVCMLAFTSGTTGKPKATMHFHRDVAGDCGYVLATRAAPTADDLFAGSPPLAFTFGLGQSVVFPMRAGAATYLLEQPSPAALLAAVDAHHITVLATAPTAYRA